MNCPLQGNINLRWGDEYLLLRKEIRGTLPDKRGQASANIGATRPVTATPEPLSRTRLHGRHGTGGRATRSLGTLVPSGTVVSENAFPTSKDQT